jgi:3-oxoacyl-[acyl-carrier protein] reductase
VDFQLTGARALVTGASAGLGASVADVLAAEGARCCVVARTHGRLEQVAIRIGGTYQVADLSTADGPQMAVDAAATALGGIDLLFVNSGGPPTGSFASLGDEAWDVAIDGTLRSALRLIRSALPHLQRSEMPSILLLLSSTVREPVLGLATSSVLRPGLAGLVKTLAGEIAPIRVNGVAPGRVDTERLRELESHQASALGVSIDEIRGRTVSSIPLGRIGQSTELARVAAFLLSPAASYVTGAIVAVDGGLVKALP